MSIKKEQILSRATELFSNEGYQHTTMQQIASLSGISKKSLYELFNSKEELFLSILRYNAQLLNDERSLIEQNANLDEKERFMKVLELYIGHDLQFYEFYKMHDMVRFGKGPIYEFAKQRLFENMKWFRQNLIMLHGNEIEPYVNDCFILFKGMATEYMDLSTKNIIVINVEELCRFLLNNVNTLANEMIARQHPPVVSVDLSTGLDVHVEKQHPLIIIKEIEKKMTMIEITAIQQEEIQESLAILSNEIKSLEPRRAIMIGMMRNLETITDLDSLHKRLIESLDLDLS